MPDRDLKVDTNSTRYLVRHLVRGSTPERVKSFSNLKAALARARSLHAQGYWVSVDQRIAWQELADLDDPGAEGQGTEGEDD